MRAARHAHPSLGMTLMLLAPLLGLGSARASAAESAAETAPASLIAALDADSYEQRERATRRLMGSERIGNKRLAKAYRNAASAETRQRLLRVITHHFYRDYKPEAFGGLQQRKDSASIGIDISPNNLVKAPQHPKLDSRALLVTETHAGFPGYVHLRPGDMILRIDGRDFAEHAGIDTFVNAIQEHEPGQRIELHVLRGGRVQRIEMKLASLQRLRRLHTRLHNTSKDPMLFPPFRQHVQKLLGGIEPAGGNLHVPAPDEQERTSGG